VNSVVIPTRFNKPIILMHSEMIVDVPSPIDLRLMADAKEWEQTAIEKRPWRTAFFERFSAEAQSLSSSIKHVLELGSGPGFLAEHMLQALPDIEMVLLDFSASMHQLAQERLGKMAGRVKFVERSFKQADWSEDLGKFDCVVTNQAVHELRHKRHAVTLHTQVRSVLNEGGIYLVCDHYAGEGGMKNDQLYMTVDEQRQALQSSGFQQIEQVMSLGGLVLHRAV
jgi:ubiquinone/menaquinone biosynthesis C-methylase UbiE